MTTGIRINEIEVQLFEFTISEGDHTVANLLCSFLVSAQKQKAKKKKRFEPGSSAGHDLFRLYGQ